MQTHHQLQDTRNSNQDLFKNALRAQMLWELLARAADMPSQGTACRRLLFVLYSLG
jgi:hypothetical protein